MWLMKECADAVTRVASTTCIEIVLSVYLKKTPRFLINTLSSINMDIYLYIYVSVYACVCVCVWIGIRYGLEKAFVNLTCFALF